MQPHPKIPIDRMQLLDALYRRYGKNNRLKGVTNHTRYWFKKYAWLVVVSSTQFFKRGLDIVVGGSALVALMPLFLAVGAAIKLTDGGPVLFWQTRVGKWGREFPFPKFRSMVVDAEKLKDGLRDLSHHESGVTFKMKKDPRITWIGRVIRKLSIDELPQLWNVLAGHMSLVGPRPPLPDEVRHYSLADRRRLDVTPGLTSLWAISGRGDIPFDQQVNLDVQYIESRSFWLDLNILLKTIPAVLLGKGAY